MDRKQKIRLRKSRAADTITYKVFGLKKSGHFNLLSGTKEGGWDKKARDDKKGGWGKDQKMFLGKRPCVFCHPPTAYICKERVREQKDRGMSFFSPNSSIYTPLL